ncbi:MAG TPA: twin-arginine translocase subunit TatC, partial [Ureibacillus sp.]|nr:twin-arginine translocase subunit TatC [Ureibacillus sp.]
SVLITPPDLISDVLVIVPLLVLYEVSVSLSRIVYRKKLLQEAALENHGVAESGQSYS